MTKRKSNPIPADTVSTAPQYVRNAEEGQTVQDLTMPQTVIVTTPPRNVIVIKDGKSTEVRT